MHDKTKTKCIRMSIETNYLSVYVKRNMFLLLYVYFWRCCCCCYYCWCCCYCYNCCRQDYNVENDEEWVVNWQHAHIHTAAMFTSSFATTMFARKEWWKKKKETRRNDVYTDIYLDDEIIAEVVWQQFR